MRHQKSKLQFNRFTSWRRATLISLARHLLMYQSIKTTHTKAKAVRPLIEKLITLAKENTLAAKRRAYAILGDHKLVSALFGEIGPRFGGRTGGYVRILSLGSRRGDGAPCAVLELTEIKKIEKKLRKKEEPQEAKQKAEEAKASQTQPQPVETKPAEEKKVKAEPKVQEKPPATKKPAKKFFGGLRNVFKKERDSL